MFLHCELKGLSPVTRNLCCQSAGGNRSGAAEVFPPEDSRAEITPRQTDSRGLIINTWFLLTGLNLEYKWQFVWIIERSESRISTKQSPFLLPFLCFNWSTLCSNEHTMPVYPGAVCRFHYDLEENKIPVKRFYVIIENLNIILFQTLLEI